MTTAQVSSRLAKRLKEQKLDISRARTVSEVQFPPVRTDSRFRKEVTRIFCTLLPSIHDQEAHGPAQIRVALREGSPGGGRKKDRG